MPRKPRAPRASEPAIDSNQTSLSEARTTETEVVIAPKSVAPNRPILTLLTGVNAGEVFSIDRAQVIVGRAREAWVRIDAVGISRKHARITKTSANELAIEDLKSTNGVYVNGKRVESAKLAPGDQVQIGSDAVLRFTMVDGAQEQLARQLFDSSTKDALTGAYNRKYFMGRLEAEVAYADRHKVRLGLMMFDLDHFKRVNDTHGHAAGDAVLRGVGDSVLGLLRLEDVFARYGGEEFAVIVRGIVGENMLRLGERLRRTVAETKVGWEGQDLTITISLGAALLEENPGAGAQGMLAAADSRLYRAKDLGRNRMVAE